MNKLCVAVSILLASGVLFNQPAFAKAIQCEVVDARTTTLSDQTLTLNFDDTAGGSQILAKDLIMNFMPQGQVQAPGATATGVLQLDVYNNGVGPLSIVGSGQVLNVNFLRSVDNAMKISVRCGTQ